MRLSKAREQIAHFLGVKPEEIVFTASGTEAINLLLRGVFQESVGGHAITTNIEHACVYNTLNDLQHKGLDVSFLSVGTVGAVQPHQIAEAIRKDTRFIVLSAVNNETGVKQDVEAIAQIAQKAGIPLFIDGVAWLGKELFAIPEGVTAMAFSGHKIHGPKGVGFAFVRSTCKLQPHVTGGGQEFNMRSGTENLPGIVGLAKAVELLSVELPSATQRMLVLRNRLEAGLMEQLDGVIVNGTGSRICNTSNLCFEKSSGEDLLIALDMAGIAVSHGSACSSGAMQPSRVLINMGLSYAHAAASLRFSLSRKTGVNEIEETIEAVASIVNRLRN